CARWDYGSSHVRVAWFAYW
nr:immunoglobulin heavy chain junction region [Mus musculus]